MAARLRHLTAQARIHGPACCPVNELSFLTRDWWYPNQVVGGALGDRRRALVEAAFGRVAAQGLEGLRLREVADDVGIDHSTLHHHIRTKQELVVEIARYTATQFAATAPMKPDPADALHEHLTALRSLMTSWPQLFVVSVELDLRARRDEEIRAVVDGMESGWRELLVDMFRRGGWQHDPATSAELVVATVKGVRHAPDRAGAVFARLESLLTGGSGSSCTS